ncbi:MAG: hypothetical protein WC615_09705 [Mucilaginibacter sp.]|jgi:hypothetical protein
MMKIFAKALEYGQAAEKQTQLPACIALTFYPGGSYLRCTGE